jgi:hypothetical protein
MTILKPLIAMLWVCASLSLGSCAHYHSYRYRLTVEVETPEGIKTGTGVSQCDFSSGTGNFLFAGGASGVSHSEAIAIDLGQRGTVFVLLIKKQGEQVKTEYVTGLPQIVMVRAGLARDGRKDNPQRYKQFTDFTREVSQVRGKIPLLISELPTIVRFRDINDPKTVEEVDPANMQATLGPGVKISRAWIEMTDDPATTGIEAKLPWVSGWTSNLTGIPMDQHPKLREKFAYSFNQRAFIRRGY